MSVLIDNLDIFLTGFKNTILLFIISFIFAFILGAIVAGFRVSPIGPLRVFGDLYVNIVRNTPLTLVMLFFALGYPKLGLWTPSFFYLAVIALSVYTATYFAEAFASGINTVPLGQGEAARSIGFRFFQNMLYIVLPQAIRSVIPAVFSVIIALLKNSTVAAGFSVFEAGAIRSYASERGENQLIVLLWVSMFFMILIFIIGFIQKIFVKKFMRV